jgi:hypothetical protein
MASHLTKLIFCSLAFLPTTKGGAQVTNDALICPIRERMILSGNGELLGTYRFVNGERVFISGTVAALLGSGGRVAGHLFVDGSEVSTASSGNPSKDKDTKTVTVSSSFFADSSKSVSIRLVSENSNGNAAGNSVTVSCQ